MELRRLTTKELFILADAFPTPLAGECKRGYAAKCERIRRDWLAASAHSISTRRD